MSCRIGMRRRLDKARLSLPVRKRFEVELERLAQVDGQGFDPDEAVLILRIVGDLPGHVVPAPFECLWRHASDFLAACLMVAVADGRYSVEQARHISVLASRLGRSAQQLARIEADTLGRLEAQGWLLMQDGESLAMSPT